MEAHHSHNYFCHTAGSGGVNSPSTNPALSGGAIAGYLVGGIISALIAALFGLCIKEKCVILPWHLRETRNPQGLGHTKA